MPNEKTTHNKTNRESWPCLGVQGEEEMSDRYLICSSSDDEMYPDGYHRIFDLKTNAIVAIIDDYSIAKGLVKKLSKPTIADYLEANKEMTDKTGCKVVTIASLKKFGGLE